MSSEKKQPKEIVADPDLVAYCGLYCGACHRYIKGKCPGCKQYSKATWCRIRSCCIYSEYSSCAECGEHADPKNCKKFHNLLSRLIARIFNSDRRACILYISEHGLKGYTRHMAEQQLPAFPLKKK